MTPEDYLNLQAINSLNASRPNMVQRVLPVAATAAAIPAFYAMNRVGNDDERWDRTAENTVGNLAGAIAGAQLGKVNPLLAIPGAIAGAIGGGYLSDRIADQFDDTDGKAMALLDAHLGTTDPYQQEAQLRAQLQQAQMMQREQQKMQRQQAMQMYQSA